MIKMYILFAPAIITSTACASSVFLLCYSSAPGAAKWSPSGDNRKPTDFLVVFVASAVTCGRIRTCVLINRKPCNSFFMMSMA